jgi:putative oxidoreductase
MEMILVHGLKKLGLTGGDAEVVPNPLHLPEAFNQLFATAANLVFPLFVIVGLFTRIAILPIIAVPLTGYFIVHGHDPLLVRDVPFMYSLSYLLVLLLGPGKYSIDYLITRPKGSSLR